MSGPTRIAADVAATIERIRQKREAMLREAAASGKHLSIVVCAGGARYSLPPPPTDEPPDQRGTLVEDPVTGVLHYLRNR